MSIAGFGGAGCRETRLTEAVASQPRLKPASGVSIQNCSVHVADMQPATHSQQHSASNCFDSIVFFFPGMLAVTVSHLQALEHLATSGH